jgi:hypothetical protein
MAHSGLTPAVDARKPIAKEIDFPMAAGNDLSQVILLRLDSYVLSNQC